MKSQHLAALAVALGVFGVSCGIGSTTETASAAPPEVIDGMDQPDTAEQELGSGLRRPPARLARTDLVTDQTNDSHLINAWGLAFGPQGAAWVAAADGHITAIYNADGKKLAPNVNIPGPRGQPGSPTGQVFNDNPSAFSGDRFILVTEEGMVVGWQQSAGTNAVVRVDASGRSAVYKGATLASFEGHGRLFAADFRNARIDVWDESFGAVKTAGFVDPRLPKGYAPFNVQETQGVLIVTFAKQGDELDEEEAGRGLGVVDLFDTNGNLITRIASGGPLNAPWAVAMTPLDFGRIPGRLLIGNFGDGRINIYRLDHSPNTKAVRARFEGQLADARGAPLAIDGLWALRFGVGAGGFDSHTLYFTAGPDEESHGVFGALKLLGR